MLINLYKYPFIIISFSLIGGILLGRFVVSYPYSLWLAILFFLICLVLTKFKRTQVLNLCIILLLCSSAMLRYHQSSEILPGNHLVTIPETQIDSCEGLITDNYYRNDSRHKYLVDVYRVWNGERASSVRGTVLVNTKGLPNRFTYGDCIRINESLKSPGQKRNPGQFDYYSYLTDKNIYYTTLIAHPDSVKLIAHDRGNMFMQHIAIPLRDYCRRTFIRYLDEDTAALVLALILGEKQDLDSKIIENFQRVGVVHVLAISGLHVGFIIAFVFSFLTVLRLGQISKIWTLIIVLIIYVILVRFKIPVIRASTMAILYLIGQVIERKIMVFNIILAALSLILIFDPGELFRPGLHFSFMAVISIVYGYQKLNQLLPLNRLLDQWGKRISLVILVKKYFWMPFLVSFAAVVGTIPLTLHYYGSVPVYALLANLIVIPLIGAMVFLSIFTLITALVSSFLTSGIAFLIIILNGWMQLMVKFTAELPYASLVTSFVSLPYVFFLYVLIILCLNIKKHQLIIFLLPVLVFLYFLLRIEKNQKNYIEVAFLDVGQGDAAFLRFPNGKTMLVDGGDASFHWDQGAKTVLPFLQAQGVLSINYLVGSHAHNDHIGGFPFLMNQLKIDTLIISKYQYHSKLFRNIFLTAADKNIPIRMVARGDQLYPDSLCRVYVLHPDSIFSQAQTRNGAECNNSSIVLKVQYGENSILFTGDLETRGERPLIGFGPFLESEIIKIGHHGSSTSTSINLLKRINPMVAIISVAQKNKFKHPSPKTILRLRENRIRTYLTSKEGALIFRVSPHDITKIAWR